MDKPGEAPGAYRCRQRRGLAALGAAVLFALLLASGVILVHPDYVAGQATTWARQFGTPGPDNAKGVGVDSAGNVYVVGQTSGTLPGQSWGGGLSDAYLKKYDQQGEEVWLRQFGGSGDDAAHAVAVDDSGNVYVAGRTGGDTAGAMMTGGASGAFLLKFDPEGAELWNRVFGLENFASSNSVAIGPQGNVLPVGQREGRSAGPNCPRAGGRFCAQVPARRRRTLDGAIGRTGSRLCFRRSGQRPGKCSRSRLAQKQSTRPGKRCIRRFFCPRLRWRWSVPLVKTIGDLGV